MKAGYTNKSIVDTLRNIGGVTRVDQTLGGAAVPQKKYARDGKAGWLTYHDQAVIKQVKLLSVETGQTQQQLAEEALNMLFAKYGKSQIA